MDGMNEKPDLTDKYPEMSEQVCMKWMQTVCILLAVYKIFYTLRFNKKYIHIVYMLTETLKKLSEFTIIFFMVLIMFALI
jgi:hypothetical protein